jgi:hypothetical protein
MNHFFHHDVRPLSMAAVHVDGRTPAVGRHQAVDALVRPLEVVVVDEQANAPLGVAQVQEDSSLHALAPHRAPEALDLAQRLRVPRRGHHLPHAAFLQLLGERTLAAPGDVG